MAIKRPTNAIEHTADSQKINLTREVSDKEKENLLNVPDRPHELQNLPIEGESRDSKRQAAEASAMAEGMSKRAEAVRKATDVEGKALPGRELANRASEVDKATKTPDRHQPQLQQAELHCKASQHNKNVKRNIPSTHGVLLEGEWSVCASSRVRDSRDSTSMSNAAVEHVDSSSEQVELASVDETESDSRKDGIGECGCIGEWSWRVETPRPTVRIPKGYCQLGRADSYASCKEMSANGQSESDKLIPTTVELDDPDGSEKPRMCLGGMKTRIGKVESHGCRADESNGQANESRSQVDASTVLNTCETASMGDSDGTGARSDAGGASHNGVGPDGHANQSDTLNGHRDVPDTGNSMNTTADTRNHQYTSKCAANARLTYPCKETRQS